MKKLFGFFALCAIFTFFTALSVAATMPGATAVNISNEVIPRIEHPPASVIFVATPQLTGGHTYAIVATSPITAVETLLLEDNRLAIDIINSTTPLSGPIFVMPNESVLGIRASQFEAATTRVVFDLAGGTNFSISITPDRQTVILTIHTATLTDIQFVPLESMDSIVLTGVSASMVRTEPRNGILAFLISNVTLAATEPEEVEGIFATDISLFHWSQNVALNVSVPPMTAFNIVQTGANETTIFLIPAPYRNMYYDFDTNTLRIPKDELFMINPVHIHRFDLYQDRQFIVQLPMHAEHHIGVGELIVNNNMLDSITIDHSLGLTRLVFNGRQLFTVDVREDDDYIIIRAVNPREIYNRIVVIDPGHGGIFPGAVRGGVRESDLNLAVTRKLLQLIAIDGTIKAYTTRNADVTLSTDLVTDLRQRAELGNNVADIFVSIHFNASTNTAANGTETYFFLEYNEFATLTNRNLANIMHRNLLQLLGTADRDVRQADFSVLRNSTIPAVLLEIAFMSNASELVRIQTEEFQWLAARAILNGLLEAFSYVYR
ncbi:MAG: N-acetylmuramoyl-L-alanine amidase [Turicibacter sp.]|nr:N-acetylmuramoyl-L-alanine amidase [Turicibacter sp.]